MASTTTALTMAAGISVRLGSDRITRSSTNSFHHDDDALRGEAASFCTPSNPQICALPCASARCACTIVTSGLSAGTVASVSPAVRAGHRLDARIGARQIRPGVVAQRPERQPAPAPALKPCDHADSASTPRSPASRPPPPCETRATSRRRDSRPTKRRASGAAGGDHLIVDQIGVRRHSVRSRRRWRMISCPAANEMRWVKPSMTTTSPSRTNRATASCIDIAFDASPDISTAGTRR